MVILWASFMIFFLGCVIRQHSLYYILVLKLSLSPCWGKVSHTKPNKIILIKVLSFLVVFVLFVPSRRRHAAVMPLSHRDNSVGDHRGCNRRSKLNWSLQMYSEALHCGAGAKWLDPHHGWAINRIDSNITPVRCVWCKKKKKGGWGIGMNM